VTPQHAAVTPQHAPVALYHGTAAYYQGEVAPHQGTYLQYSRSFDKLRMTKRNGNKKPRPGRTAGQRKGLWAEASFCLDYSPFNIFKGVHELPSVGFASFWSSKRKKKKKSSALVVKKSFTKEKVSSNT
jgi:hypothetical protein